MAHLIDKDKVVAEITKRYEYWREKEFNSHSIESEARMSECQHLMLLFNSIETKEVDLERKLNGFQNFYAHENSGEYPSAIDIAKYFYELGFNTQKGE